ncbi:MAG TPA: hypothetical protein VGQ41_18755 [Pyrinomonadaceae bacterium]|jgi:hypothetical protein|nr:hypothetical protein [Pyrinomonadaceae bacterium]
MKLKALIAQYVAFRKSLGARFENREGRLNAFCRWMGEEINVTDVQAERVNAFLRRHRPSQPQLAGEMWSIERPLSLCDQPRLS